MSCTCDLHDCDGGPDRECVVQYALDALPPEVGDAYYGVRAARESLATLRGMDQSTLAYLDLALEAGSNLGHLAPDAKGLRAELFALYEAAGGFVRHFELDRDRAEPMFQANSDPRCPEYPPGWFSRGDDGIPF